ncbi:unnamed protein product, partial [Nesidiocoris tenuis]
MPFHRFVPFFSRSTAFPVFPIQPERKSLFVYIKWDIFLRLFKKGDPGPSSPLLHFLPRVPAAE